MSQIADFSANGSVRTQATKKSGRFSRAENGRFRTRETNKFDFPGQKWPELAEKLWANAWYHSDQGPIIRIYLNLAVDF